MTEEEYIEYIEWRAEQERKIEMTDIRDLVRPFSEIYTKEEVQSAKDETKLLQSEFDECVKMMSEPVKEDRTNNCKTNKRTFFIAKCGSKYLKEWCEPQFTSYVWSYTPTKFDTKEECLEAVASTNGQSGKPDSPVIIMEMKETVITEVVSEECL